MLRVATSVVSPVGRGQPDENATRRAWAETAVDVLAAMALDGSKLLVLPAGFLSCNSRRGVEHTARGLLDYAARRHIFCCVGVDVTTSTASEGKPTGKAQEPRGAELPYAVLAYGPEMNSPATWWQRSRTASEGRALSSDSARESRRLDISGTPVDVLACGEVFSPKIRDALTVADSRVVVFPAHTAGGSRHGSGAIAMQKKGAAVFRAVHAQTARTRWASDDFAGTEQRLAVNDHIWLYLTDLKAP